MLLNLHVKNLALIEEADVDFKKGLVVITGETGAGKSLILGSVNIALGNKVSKDIIRNGCEYALVELTFSLDENTERRLNEYDLYSDENTVTVSRKITAQRSVAKINGETVNVSILKNVMKSLVDIHGQHDHQSLLYKSKHLEILDKFAVAQIGTLSNEISENYRQYNNLTEKLKNMEMDENQRVRELEFSMFEVNEINDADIVPGEDDELEKEYKSISSGEKTVTGLEKIHGIITDDMGMSDMISKCIDSANEIDEHDTSVKGIKDELYNIESLLRDVSREVYDYLSTITFDPERVNEIENRLDLINHLKLKYGQTIEDIFEYRDKKQKVVDELNNYEENMSQLKVEISKLKDVIIKQCEKMSEIRKKAALELEKQVVASLKDLNFLQVDFKIAVERKKEFNEKGFDDVEFLISTNPGEPVRPLGKVASGGELSRIMLAIKSILASEDDVDTLIFDEIDTGISGVTATMVANKLALISRKRQVICISHLAQIAAMADYHYLIEKNIKNNETFTNIVKLNEEQSINELVRISTGTQITESAVKHAKEMKEMAERTKISQI